MAKTNTEKIEELARRVATVEERLDHVRKQVEALWSTQERLAVLEERSRASDQASTRRWSLWPPLIAAIAGSILGSLLTHFLVLRARN